MANWCPSKGRIVYCSLNKRHFHFKQNTFWQKLFFASFLLAERILWLNTKCFPISCILKSFHLNITYMNYSQKNLHKRDQISSIKILLTDNIKKFYHLFSVKNYSWLGVLITLSFINWLFLKDTNKTDKRYL